MAAVAAGSVSLVFADGGDPVEVQVSWDVPLLAALGPAVQATLLDVDERGGTLLVPSPPPVLPEGALLLCATGDRAMLRVPFPSDPVEAVRDVGGTPLWPGAMARGRVTLRAILPHRAALQDLVARLGASAIRRATPARLSAIEALPLVLIMNKLTRRQAMILKRAIDLGFYDMPRRASGADLGDALDLSHGTVLEHLRKAERAVLAELGPLMDARSHEAVWKGVGRPRKSDP